MALYLRPPDFITTLPKFRTAVITRFRFLLDILSCDDQLQSFQDLLLKPEYASHADMLWENSHYDRASHFALIMLCSRQQRLSRLLIDAELALFDFRIRLMTFDELKQSIRVACRQAKQSAISESDLKSALISLTKAGYQRLAEGAWMELKEEHGSARSKDISVTVPFTIVPDMVAKRAVKLNRGMATVHFDRFTSLLRSIFKSSMIRNLAVATAAWKEGRMVDERMDRLFDEIVRIANRPMASQGPSTFTGHLQGRLTSSGIDPLLPVFPPCMVNLHGQLRMKHRLRHHSRIQYTLFLKGLGMPIQEAIQFWKEEYSRPPGDPNCHHRQVACQHDWSKEEKRYVYNLRHLYGLEGSRRNYSPHCCGTLQSRHLAIGEEGGCPFQHFDPASLRRFLQKDMGVFDRNILSRIMDLVENTSPKNELGLGSCSQACALVLNSKLRHGDTTSQPVPDLEDLSTSRPWFLSQPTEEVLEEMREEDEGCCDGEFCTCGVLRLEIPGIVIRRPQDYVRALLKELQS